MKKSHRGARFVDVLLLSFLLQMLNKTRLHDRVPVLSVVRSAVAVVHVCKFSKCGGRITSTSSALLPHSALVCHKQRRLPPCVVPGTPLPL
jgi:anti-anti-sigma regulatory factor